MKKLTFLVVAVFVVGTIVQAQEEPIPPKRARAMKVGLYGGFMPGYLFLDTGPINAFLTGGKGAPLRDGGVFMTGGGGAAYIMVIPNVRVGGMGMSGGLTSNSIDASNIRREAEMHVGIGGVTIDYVLPIVDRFDVAFGVVLGWGGLDLTLHQSNGGANTWQSEQALFGSWTNGSPNNMTRELSGSFFLYSPSINFEYAILGWLAVRLGASYVGMASGSWDVDGEFELLGVPSDVSGRGFMIQGGVLVGTF
jgi:hypothetical protein